MGGPPSTGLQHLSEGPTEEVQPEEGIVDPATGEWQVRLGFTVHIEVYRPYLYIHSEFTFLHLEYSLYTAYIFRPL